MYICVYIYAYKYMCNVNIINKILLNYEYA